MFKIIISLITLLSFCLLLFLLNITTPANAGPFGILAILIFAYLISLGFMTLFLYIIGLFAAKVSALVVTRKPIEKLSFRQAYIYSTVFAAVPIMLIGLQSVGSVGVYEILLIVFFVAIGVLYISKKIG